MVKSMLTMLFNSCDRWVHATTCRLSRYSVGWWSKRQWGRRMSSIFLGDTDTCVNIARHFFPQILIKLFFKNKFHQHVLFKHVQITLWVFTFWKKFQSKTRSNQPYLQKNKSVTFHELCVLRRGHYFKYKSNQGPCPKDLEMKSFFVESSLNKHYFKFILILVLKYLHFYD